MTTPVGWKGPDKFGLTTYQRIVIISIIIVITYQIMLMIIFSVYNNDILWKAALIFSGGISAGGYILAVKSLWQMENYEKKYRQAIFDQYGIDIENTNNRSIITFFNENEEVFLEALDEVDKGKLKDWLQDTVKNINNYEKMPDRPKWAKSFEGTACQSEENLKMRKKDQYKTRYKN